MLRLTSIFLIATFGLTAEKVALEKYAGDYKRMVNAFKIHSGISVDVGYKAFGLVSKTGTAPSTTIKYYFKGNRFYYNAGSTEVLKTEDYLVGISHLRKTIMISEGGTEDEFQPLSVLDTLLQNKSVKVSYKEKAQLGYYSLDYGEQSTDFNKMEIEFDKSSFLVDRIRLYLSPGRAASWSGEEKPVSGSGKMGIEYVFSNYRFTNMDDGIFALNHFGPVKGNEFKVAAKYAGYKIIAMVKPKNTE